VSHHGAAWRWAAGLALGAAVAAGCQEQLTAPGVCPEMCPGGTSRVYDTIITVATSGGIGLDSSFAGYVPRGGGVAVLVSNGLAASEDRAVYRFVPRSDSISVRDTLRPYTVDSVLLKLTIVARDTLVNNLGIQLYRLPPTVDSTVTFGDVDAQLVDANFIGSIAVPDSVNTGTVSTMLRGPDADRVALPPGGDSVLAIGVRITADSPTGVRLGSQASSSAASFTSYVTVDVPDTGSLRNQVVNRATAFNTFVTQAPMVPTDSLLSVGGEPSSRALIRFAIPRILLDSITLVRATLVLTPAAPILGLPTDPALLEARAIVGDLGQKSPVTTDPRFIISDTLPAVQSDTVRFEVTRTVQLWQTNPERPQALFMILRPEAATFTRAQFGSSRSPSVPGPRLRLTFERRFTFEAP
jgi:hypothetical protein